MTFLKCDSPDTNRSHICIIKLENLFFAALRLKYSCKAEKIQNDEPNFIKKGCAYFLDTTSLWAF